MLENAIFPIHYFDPALKTHFSEIRVGSDSEGFIYISGTRDLTKDAPKAVVNFETNGIHDWLLAYVDATNPLIDAHLAHFWKTSPLPYAVKNAVEEIAYQHRRIISASAQWQECIRQAQRRGVHPFCLPLTLRQHKANKGQTLADFRKK